MSCSAPSTCEVGQNLRTRCRSSCSINQSAAIAASGGIPALLLLSLLAMSLATTAVAEGENTAILLKTYQKQGASVPKLAAAAVGSSVQGPAPPAPQILGSEAVPSTAAAPAPASQPQQSAPQRVLDVLLGLYHNYAGHAVKAAQQMLGFGLKDAEHAAVQLPQCRRSNVLLHAGQFPSLSWTNLTAQQQALHPINMVMMQLSYMAYRSMGDLDSCLTGMGADLSTLHNVTVPVSDFTTFKSAYVFRASKERVFVLFRGSCESDIAINIACRQEQVTAEYLGMKGQQMFGVHMGYWKAWQALETGVVSAVQELLKEVPSKEVYITGHSLGAALGSIAAMRLNALLPRGVSGVWLFAAPRAGNRAWAQAYNSKLLRKTVRFSNHMDFAVRVPAVMQSCSLGSYSLQAETGRFDYTHVGQGVLMCPDLTTGLTQFRVSPTGTDSLDCFAANDIDATAATHQMGSYFDAWRRGYVNHAGSSLADDLRVQAVLCEGCTVHTARFRMQQVRNPARPGGPVTCTVDATCSSPKAYTASLSVDNITAPRLGNVTTCQAFTCMAQPANAG